MRVGKNAHEIIQEDEDDDNTQKHQPGGESGTAQVQQHTGTREDTSKPDNNERWEQVRVGMPGGGQPNDQYDDAADKDEPGHGLKSLSGFRVLLDARQ